MDTADHAQLAEQHHRERALNARSKATAPSKHHCEDCGIAIPEARRSMPGVTRCIDCQTEFEET